MEKFPLPLICLTAQHVIDDPHAIEALLQKDPDVEKCIPLALKETFNLTTIPDAKTTLEHLLIIWQGIPDESDRVNAYIKAASEGRTYLLPYIKANPRRGLTWGALTWATRYGHIDTMKYLVKEPLKYFSGRRVDERLLVSLLHIAISSSQYLPPEQTIAYVIAMIKNVIPYRLASILNDAYDYTDSLIRTNTETLPFIDQVYATLNKYTGQHRKPISTSA